MSKDHQKDYKNKGQCTTGPMAKTVQSSKQLNFWKSRFWAQNLTSWPMEDLGKSFTKDNIYIVWNALLLSNFMQKIKKFWRRIRKQSLKKSNFGPNLTFWPAHKGSRVFFENQKTSLFYNHAVLTLCKISKLSGTRILRYQCYGQTDEQTDEWRDKAEFIGLFQLKPCVQKVCERYQSLSKEEKENKQQYGRERYKNLPEN